MQQHAAYATDVSEHDGWDFFFESVWPSETSWLIIMDRRVIDQLVKAGSDPAKPHAIEFVFRGEPPALAEMRRVLEARGYTLVESAPAEARLVMALRLPLDLTAISGESIAHRDACARLGLDYSGWGASVEA
jgi:hypothetical protein